MLTYNKILNEIKNLPSNRLEEVYHLIHSLKPKAEINSLEDSRRKILNFAGAFNDMNSKDYMEFLKYMYDTRNKLLDRKNML